MGYKPPRPQTPDAPPIPAVAKNPHTQMQEQEYANRRRAQGIAATWLRDIGGGSVRKQTLGGA